MTHSSFGAICSLERTSRRHDAIQGLFDEGEEAASPSSVTWDGVGVADSPAAEEESDAYLDTDLPMFQIADAWCEVLKIHKSTSIWDGYYVDVDSRDYGKCDYLVFVDYDQAVYATAQHWIEMLDYSPKELMCFAGDNVQRLIQWVQIIEEARHDYSAITELDMPESCFGTYDGSYDEFEAFSKACEDEFPFSLENAVAFRHN